MSGITRFIVPPRKWPRYCTHSPSVAGSLGYPKQNKIPSHNAQPFFENTTINQLISTTILTWRGRGSCSPKRVINKARRLIEYTALHAAVCVRLWLRFRLYVRRRIFARVGLCACRRPRTITIKLLTPIRTLYMMTNSFQWIHTHSSTGFYSERTNLSPFTKDYRE